jgi:microcompartment protein CcmL/EutN
MLKEADISIIWYDILGKTQAAIYIREDIGSVQIAIDSGVDAVKQTKGYIRAMIIANSTRISVILLARDRGKIIFVRY